MNRLATAVAVLALSVVPALAQEDVHSLALKAVAVGFEPQISTRIMETYWPASMDLIHLRKPDVTDLEMFQYEGKITTFAEEAARATMAPMVKVLEAAFTPDELKTMIAFYETPAGRKLNSTSGIIQSTMTTEVARAIGPEVKAFQAKIDAMIAADLPQ